NCLQGSTPFSFRWRVPVVRTRCADPALYRYSAMIFRDEMTRRQHLKRPYRSKAPQRFRNREMSAFS
ncbi:hypothetical protein PENTCL1PPCAC_9529, partial [Pristionchus entomophagus]